MRLLEFHTAYPIKDKQEAIHDLDRELLLLYFQVDQESAAQSR